MTHFAKIVTKHQRFRKEVLVEFRIATQPWDPSNELLLLIARQKATVHGVYLMKENLL